MCRPWVIEWIDDDTVKILAAEINKNDLAKRLETSMTKLEEFVKEKILFGISLESLGISFDFSRHRDTGDEQTRGYSPIGSVDLEGESFTISNEDSDKLLNAMVETGALGLQMTENEEVVWERGLTTEWVANIHNAWTEFYPLKHQSAGPPGRGTEEALFNARNTENGRRHVYFKDNTIGFGSNYHKGHLASGVYKYILRLIPYRLAVIFMILIRVVRPIELMALMEFHIRPDDAKKAARGLSWQSLRYMGEGLDKWTFNRCTRCLVHERTLGILSV